MRMRTGGARAACMIGLAVALLAATGCGDGGAPGRGSSRRVFLEKLVLPASVVGPGATLAERRIAAHDGLGRIDVASLEQPLNGPAEPDAAAAPTGDAEDADTVVEPANEDAAAAPGQHSEVAGDAVASLERERREALTRRVRPLGPLEGYGEAVYVDAAGAPVLRVTYRLSEYPVDYYRHAAAGANADGAAAEAAPAEGATDADAPVPAAPDAGAAAADGKAAADLAVGSMPATTPADGPAEDAVSVHIEAAPAEAHADGDSEVLFRVTVDGLTASIGTEPGREAGARRYAEALADRLVREITSHREALRKMRDRMANRGPGAPRLTGFWGHMSDRLSMEDKAYRILKAGF